MPPALVAGGLRFRLRGSVEPVLGGDGALYLVRAGADDLVVRDAEPVDLALFDVREGHPSGFWLYLLIIDGCGFLRRSLDLFP